MAQPSHALLLDDRNPVERPASVEAVRHANRETARRDRLSGEVPGIKESAGYEAVAFESAEAFLMSGTLTSVVCVIADVRLPGMDGTELQRRIRQQRRQLPVILITAHDDDDVRRQALRDGAVAFLVKPFDGGDLLGHIARVVTNYS